MLGKSAIMSYDSDFTWQEYTTGLLTLPLHGACLGEPNSMFPPVEGCAGSGTIDQNYLPNRIFAGVEQHAGDRPREIRGWPVMFPYPGAMIEGGRGGILRCLAESFPGA